MASSNSVPIPPPDPTPTALSDLSRDVKEVVLPPLLEDSSSAAIIVSPPGTLLNNNPILSQDTSSTVLIDCLKIIKEFRNQPCQIPVKIRTAFPQLLPSTPLHEGDRYLLKPKFYQILQTHFNKYFKEDDDIQIQNMARNSLLVLIQATVIQDGKINTGSDTEQCNWCQSPSRYKLEKFPCNQACLVSGFCANRLLWESWAYDLITREQLLHWLEYYRYHTGYFCVENILIDILHVFISGLTT